MHIDDSSAMEILKEIKELMDSRMTDKMSMPDVDVASEIPDAKGIELQKIKLLGGQKDGLGDDSDVEGSPSEESDDELMKKIRKELM